MNRWSALWFILFVHFCFEAIQRYKLSRCKQSNYNRTRVWKGWLFLPQYTVLATAKCQEGQPFLSIYLSIYLYLYLAYVWSTWSKKKKKKHQILNIKIPDEHKASTFSSEANKDFGFKKGVKTSFQINFESWGFHRLELHQPNCI